MKKQQTTSFYSSLHPGFVPIIFFLLLAAGIQGAFAQVKTASTNTESRVASFEILDNGDTINKMDSRNMKQGKWLIVSHGGYGEEDFMDYGTFADDIKTGQWKRYDMNGRIIADEFYRRGNRDGEARYYDEGLLYCVGNYLALKSRFEYDTIMVEDPVTNAFKPVVIKSDVGSVRHGFWTFYDPPSTQVRKVIEYQADEVIYEKEYLSKVDSTYIKARIEQFPHVSNQPQPNVWIMEKGRKPATYTDIPENAQYVVPNKRRR